MSLPASSIARAAPRPAAIASRRISSAICAATGRSRVASPAEPATEAPLLNVRQAAKQLGLAPSTVLRCLDAGFIPGEQVTPGAPWRIRLDDKLQQRFAATIPDGFLAMRETIRRLGVSRQTVLQRIKRGELIAVHVRQGRRKGIYIKALEQQPGLFEQLA